MLAHPDAVVAALRAEPGMKVADFGAGQGSHVAGLSEAVGPAGRVYAIDVQKALVDRLAIEAKRRGLANVDALWADLEVARSSGLADGALDRVLASHVLFQADSRAAIVAEAFRVLKPGGRALFVEWSPEAPAARLHGDRVVSPVALADLVAAAGFKDGQAVSVGAAQHALVAQKP
jgi:ubiquinone/menaquinone biosynthesis C-methylase UbiE